MRRFLMKDGVEIPHIKSITFKESVNASEDLRPGTVCSASIQVKAYGKKTDAITTDSPIQFYKSVDESTAELIGTFYPEPSIDTRNSYTFDAYDAASKLDADFSEWLAEHQDDFPMRLADLVGHACTVAGVTVEGEIPFANTAIQAFYSDNLTCRSILSYAAEIGCKFVRCNAAGNLVFDWYYENNDYGIAPSGGAETIAYKQDGLTYANYETSVLDRVAVHPAGNDDVAYIYPVNATGNTLHIINNLLLTNAEPSTFTAIAQAVYNGVAAIGSYRPMEANLFPFENVFRAGQIVSVSDIQGVTFQSVITEMVESETSSLLVSSGNRKYSSDETSEKKAIAQLLSDIVRINKLKVDWAQIETAVIGALEAQGVDAAWIRAGILQSTDPSKFYLNLDTGELNMDVSSLQLNGEDMSLVIQGQVGPVQADLSDLRAHIVVGSDGSMTFIGATGNPITLKLLNDQVAIYNGGTLVDSFAAAGTMTQNLIIPASGSLSMGNFKWTPRSSGSLDLVWVG